MNEELYKFQKEWFDTIFEPYIKENPNANITYPFFTGVPEQYVNSNKRIMIIGQETRGWGIYKPDWTLKDSRQWTVDYLVGFFGETMMCLLQINRLHKKDDAFEKG